MITVTKTVLLALPYFQVPGLTEIDDASTGSRKSKETCKETTRKRINESNVHSSRNLSSHKKQRSLSVIVSHNKNERR